MKVTSWQTVFSTVIAILLSASVHGDGFRNPPAGSAALAKAGVHSVYVDDPSAISQNPAALLRLEEAELMAAFTIGYSEGSFTGPSGMTAETKDPVKMLPNLYYVMPLEAGKLAAGLGITTPYGQSTVWEKNGAFRYSSPHFAEMMLLDINPTLTYAVNDRLTVAGGLNLYWSELELRQYIPWAGISMDPSDADGELAGEGDGLGFGVNAAILWNVSEKQTAALTYRSAFDITYEGDTTLSRIPVGKLPPPLAGLSGSSNFETETKFPNIVALGYGLQISDTARIEAQVEWLEHSQYQTLNLDLGRNGPILPVSSIPQNWDDAWTFGLGGDLKINDSWTAHAGYAFIESPIPDATFSPNILDNDRHVIAAGATLEKDRHTLGFSYAYSIIEDREITANQNPAFNGTYEIDAHLFAFSYGYSL